MARFGQVVTAMVTPFGPDGSLDLDAAAALARWLVEWGSDALVVAGTTGEGPVLSDDEKGDLWRAVKEAVTVPVIAGTGTNDTRHSVELTRRAADCRVDAMLVVTPYYNRPSQSGIEMHFRAVAASAPLVPVIVYDIPVRTGRRVAPEVMRRLVAEVPNVLAVKDATGDVAGAARLLADAPSSFEVYSGDDALTLPLLSVGGVGVVSVASHWAGLWFREMISAYHAGDVARARLLNVRLLESYAFEASDETPNPIPAKAMMRVLGQQVGECRAPLGPAPHSLELQARDVLIRLAGLGGSGGTGAFAAQAEAAPPPSEPEPAPPPSEPETAAASERAAEPAPGPGA